MDAGQDGSGPPHQITIVKAPEPAWWVLAVQWLQGKYPEPSIDILVRP